MTWSKQLPSFFFCSIGTSLGFPIMLNSKHTPFTCWFFFSPHLLSSLHRLKKRILTDSTSKVNLEAAYISISVFIVFQLCTTQTLKKLSWFHQFPVIFYIYIYFCICSTNNKDWGILNYITLCKLYFNLRLYNLIMQ